MIRPVKQKLNPKVINEKNSKVKSQKFDKLTHIPQQILECEATQMFM